MADTWDEDPLRPLARPQGLVPERSRPRLRPDAEGAQDTAALDAEQLRPRIRPDRLGQVPEETETEATSVAALDLSTTALIGLFSGPEGSTALVRLQGGSIVRVAEGGFVAGGRVTAISEDGLRLFKDGEEIVLTMPS